MIFDELNKIDWDFKGKSTSYLTHRWHSYPAKFIPQIPHELIKILSNPGNLILDPFCGSGTTLVEARIQGRPSIGVDINPLSVLISKVKATPLDCLELEKETSHVRRLIESNSVFENTQTRIEDFMTSKKDHPELSVEIPQIPNIQHWFEPHVIEELGIIKAAISHVTNPDIQDFLKICLSSIIVRVSNQDSNTRYVRRKKDISPSDTCRIFLKQAERMQKDMTRFGEKAQNVSVRTYTADSRNLSFIADETVDSIVTSPPYLNAYDYHLYHRFRLFWLDMDPVEVKKSEIGAHLSHSYDDNSVDRYFEDMKQCIEEFDRILSPGKYIAIVIGTSIVKGKLIDTVARLLEISESIGFAVPQVIQRSIPSGSKSFNPELARLKRESIIILKK